PPDHDDDDGGAVRGTAADARHRHRIGAAPSARGDDRRWADPEPGAHPVHDAGYLSRLRSPRPRRPPALWPPVQCRGQSAVSPSTPFIERPVATTLLTIGVALAGLFAFGKLPVAPLPQVDFPTISAFAQMPGASPETMA